MHSSKPGNQDDHLNITGNLGKDSETLSRMFSWIFAVRDTFKNVFFDWFYAVPKVCEVWNHVVDVLKIFAK